MATINNLVIDQGTTFSMDLNVTNDDGTAKDLANYSVAAQIRKTYGATTAVDFSSTKVNAEGKITLSLTATQTSALKAGRFVYDCEITATSPAETLRIVEGIITVTPEFTR